MKILTHFRKIAIIFLSIFIVLFALSGAYNTQNIDRLAYVIALGLDVGENEPLKLSIQLSRPGSTKSSSDQSSDNNIVNSVECSSIESGLNLFDSYISRKINLSHCKVVVISEELASKGVSDYAYTLLNSVEMSPHANVIISKSPSEKFLNSSQPILESLASNYYEIALSSSEYTGLTQNVTLIKFFSDYVDTFRNPVAILGAVNSKDTNSLSNSTTNDSTDSTSDINKDSSYVAGQTPISSKDNIENMGLAVFNGDKLVGELNGLESIFHLIVSNQLKSCNISIPNPLGDSDSIDVNLSLKSSTKNNVQFVNGSPYITSDIKLNIKILSATEQSSKSDSDYFSDENMKQIEDACNKYLSENITNYLYKTAKEYHSDIDGFGKHAVKYFLTMQEWNDYNWLDNYKNSTFNVTVDSTLKSGYTFL